MSENKTIAIVTCAILLVLLSAFTAVQLFPKVIPIAVEKQVPVEKIVVQNVTVEKVVDKLADLQASAVSEYKAELADDDDYLICDGEQYDLDQVVYKSVDNLQVSVDSSDKDDTVSVVSWEQDLKFSDKDVESKCYRTDAVSVEFHSDEDIDTEVIIA